MSYSLHPVAEIDLSDAAAYYAREASNTVATAFLAEFDKAMEIIVKNQQLGTPARAGLRIFPLHRFPYSIVYREAERGPRVYAVAHQRREPKFWQGRV